MPRIEQHKDPTRFLSADKVDWDAICANHDYVYCWRVLADYRKELENAARWLPRKGRGSVWRVAKRPLGR